MPMLTGSAMFDRRFVIVAGKGGVGKSTVSAALALCAARRGRRVLVVELAAREKVAMLLGHPAPVGYRATRVAERIDVINATPERALHEYGLLKLHFEGLYRVVFENPVMRALVRVIPGMNELLLIGKAWHLEQETDPATGRPRWDMVIVDSPATGHGIALLDLPHVVSEAVTAGPMAEEVRAIRDRLVDPRRTVMHLVTLPEEMPVNETLELERRMSTALRTPPGFLFVNGVWPMPLPDDEQAILSSFCSTTRCLPRFEPVLDTLAFMRDRRAAQEEHIERLRRECRLPRIEIPYRFVPHFDRAAVEGVSQAIDAALTERERQAA